MFDYPKVNETAIGPLKAVFQNAMEFPNYFDRSPYSRDLITFVKKYVRAMGTGPVLGVSSSDIKKAREAGMRQGETVKVDVEAECLRLYSELTEFRKSFEGNGNGGGGWDDGGSGSGGDMKVSEHMAFFRTATSLLERLLNLRDKAVGQKQADEFKKLVMSTLDQVLTQEQRDRFVAELGKLG